MAISDPKFKELGSFYDIQNYWSFGHFPSSGILETRKSDVSETGSVFVLRYRGGTHLLSWIS
jgi:hypothetical protein